MVTKKRKKSLSKREKMTRSARKYEYRLFVFKGGYMPFSSWDKLFRSYRDDEMINYKKKK